MLTIFQSWITLRARETAALGRELLGGNGILADFLVAKVLMPNFLFEIYFVKPPVGSRLKWGNFKWIFRIYF